MALHAQGYTGIQPEFVPMKYTFRKIDLTDRMTQKSIFSGVFLFAVPQAAAA